MSTTDLAPVLEQVRKDLLDLTVRNRLLSAPVDSRRANLIEIVGERSEAVFQILVRDRRPMGFRAGPAAAGPPAEPGSRDPLAMLPPPDETDDAARHHDLWLQTPLPAERLQSRLLRLAYEARSLHEERGVHVLYLALGFLTWFEAPAAETARHAPLVLIPVRLERAGARERFRLSFPDEEIVPNVCLVEKLRRDFGIQAPALPDPDDLDLDAWYEAMTAAVAGEARFAVEPDRIALGLFSFTRLLMWRDLDPALWPEAAPLGAHPLLAALLGDGFRDGADGLLADDVDLDRLLPAAETVHVVDADGSQAVAIEEVRRGRNLLIQGPPGTGKSQTITNLIARAAHAGKRVLFVAEKMAALDVVRRRLDALDLGPLCLELHSRRASRRAVLEELRRTLDLGRADAPDTARVAAELERSREVLNRYARALHRPREPSGLTPFELIGHLVRLGPVASKGVALDSGSWTRAGIERRRGLVAACAQRIGVAGLPAAHPWRGVRLEVALPSDQRRFAEHAGSLARYAEALRLAGGRLAADLGHQLGPDPGLSAIEQVVDTAEFLALAPAGIDAAALLDPAWRVRRPEIRDLATAGRVQHELAAELGTRLTPAALDADARDLRDRHARYLRRWWRAVLPGWWWCRRRVGRLFRGAPPAAPEERLQVLDRLVLYQAARRLLAAEAALGRSAFGHAWRDLDSDFACLADVEHWEREGRAAHLLEQAPERLIGLAHPGSTAELAASAQRVLDRLKTDLQALIQDLALDLEAAFGIVAIPELPLRALEDRLRAWSAAGEALQGWIAFRRDLCEAKAAGLDPLLEPLLDGRVAPEAAVPVFEVVVFEGLLRRALKAEPALAVFDGTSFEDLVERFRRLDQERIDLARAEVACAHDRALPRRVAGGGGQLGILEQEFRKKRRHLSIRKLLASAGGAIQAIKPVFMMSPLSVAEFLSPGALGFDLLLIDEASQVEPVDALGAIARCRQIVVVGDERQLPPTPFFRERAGDDEPGAEDEHPAQDLESILGLCAARGIPQRMLRWHYRSRHPSLIAVSNRAFYDDRLYVVPSPFEDAPDLGLAFHHVADGVYDRGGSRTNPIEARRVAAAVIDHARARPHLSLGVGCFSVAQRDLILAELERLRRGEPELEAFFGDGGPEPFFVKNLETLQGDERDVVMISIGYARDGSGYLAMSFGPLNADGGERRLNVMISRARRRLLVFSSITAADLDLARSDRPGVRVLKTFLNYAESGILGIATPGGRGPDSPFEEAVADALRARGLDVAHQIGVAGFFVDLAVRDPERPGRHLLGIECDGAAWHSARWARDRDRLRQQVLEDQGWIVHRIWSSEWFRRPEKELERVLGALERARAVWRARDLAGAGEASARAASPRPIPRLAAPARDEADPEPIGIPYLEAAFELNHAGEVHLMPRGLLLEALVRIVRVEGPVHRDEIARRLTRLAGLARTGRRIADAVEEGLRAAVRSRRLEQAGGFYAVPGAAIVVRDRSQVGSTTLRRPKMLPPAEIRAAIMELVRQRIGLSPEDAVIQTSRAFGFQTTSGPLRAVVEAERDALVEGGALDLDDQGLLQERRPAA